MGKIYPQVDQREAVPFEVGPSTAGTATTSAPIADLPRSLEARTRYELLTIGEAAFYLRVSPPTIRELVRSGRLSAVSMGRKLFFTSYRLMEFIDAGARQDELEP